MSLRLLSVLATATALTLGNSLTIPTPPSEGEAILTHSSSQLLAQMPREAKGKQWRKGRFLEQLGLTDAQKQEIEQIREKYQPQITQLRTSLQSARQELNTMMAGTESSATIRAKHQEIVQLRQEMGNLRFESMLEMREVLSMEQRSQLAQMMQQRRGNFRNRSGDR